MAKKTDPTASLAAVVKSLKKLPESERAWVLQSAANLLAPATQMNPGTSTALAGTSLGVAVTKQTDAKIFLRNKKPQNDVQRIACLAYISAHIKDSRQFKANDLSRINIEAAGPSFDIRRAVDNAGRSAIGYLSIAGKGFKQLTALGEEIVDALPDYDKVKAIGAEDKKTRRRKIRRRSKNKG